MEQIRVSAMSIGALALPDFCPRCFWIKLHCSYRLPYQTFPGIFSSIDSYSGKITHVHYERLGRLPDWIAGLVPEGKPVKVPHYSKFSVLHEDTNILVVGRPDEIFQKADGSYFIIDRKTAKLTAHQDSVSPLYKAQLNTYAYIAERVGFKPVSGLGLIYYEPLTDVTPEDLDSVVREDGFTMRFSAKLLPVELDVDRILPLLARVRETYDLPHAPKGTEGCRDCELIQVMDNLDPVARLVEHGREERFLEYKASAPWDGLRQKIAKTALGMSNIKGGGTILIGVAKKGEQYVPEGMQDEHTSTYVVDEVRRYVDRFADPYVRLDVQEVRFDGKKYLVVTVHEFDQLPVICKRDYNRFMRQGAIYTRSIHVPETCEIRSQNEMREIVAMAVEKGIVTLARTRTDPPRSVGGSHSGQ